MKLHRTQKLPQRHALIAGISLLEMVVAVGLIAILAMVAVPSYQSVIEKNRVVRLTDEVHGFLLQAKSEAVMKNDRLKIKLIRDDTPAVNTEYRDGMWILALLLESSTASDISSAKAEAMSILDGDAFKNTGLSVTSLEVVVEPVRGVFSNNLSAIITNNLEASTTVKVSNISGRISICSQQGSYGYVECV
ncbi:Tfp pilus assembly protein FimT/FimU [Thaumasiovibrio sp. DFM-14]|uniref:pilus assembly FimT family protein n=1 Tax=Thaumasiovibrio sp. DFM-14 TaxID=3384792 RepID=UPI00399FC6AB